MRGSDILVAIQAIRATGLFVRGRLDVCLLCLLNGVDGEEVLINIVIKMPNPSK